MHVLACALGNPPSEYLRNYSIRSVTGQQAVFEVVGPWEGQGERCGCSRSEGGDSSGLGSEMDRGDIGRGEWSGALSSRVLRECVEL